MATDTAETNEVINTPHENEVLDPAALGQERSRLVSKAAANAKAASVEMGVSVPTLIAEAVNESPSSKPAQIEQALVEVVVDEAPNKMSTVQKNTPVLYEQKSAAEIIAEKVEHNVAVAMRAVDRVFSEKPPALNLDMPQNTEVETAEEPEGDVSKEDLDANKRVRANRARISAIHLQRQGAMPGAGARG